MELSRENIEAFLRAKHTSPKCPSCDHNNWVLGKDERSFTGKLMLPRETVEEADFSLPPAFLPVVFLVCSNCGHVRWYSHRVISRWVEAQKEEEPAAEAEESG